LRQLRGGEGINKVIVVSLYELRRALARKKVLVLIYLSLIFEVAVYIALFYVKDNTSFREILPAIGNILWLVGTLLPQSLLIHFIALSISSGSLSEEYEQGTVDFFLTKPIGRAEFVLGKYLGGLTLVVLIYLLMVTLSILLSWILFQPQGNLIYLPQIFASVVISALAFYSLGFMTGEVFRRSSIAYIISSTILISSLLIGIVLNFVYGFTKNSIYIMIAKALPNWGATQLPIFIASSIPNSSVILPFLEVGPSLNGTIYEALGYVVSYSISFTLISLLSFLSRDIPKRIS
jgi:ABC-2 type transport system permease protein